MQGVGKRVYGEEVGETYGASGLGTVPVGESSWGSVRMDKRIRS